MARHKIPSELKKIQGTFRPDREDGNRVKVKAGIPEPLSGLLTKDSEFHYYRIAKILSDMRVLSKSDVITLELIAIFTSEFHKLTNRLKKGRTFKQITREGSIIAKKRPEWTMRNEVYQNLIGLLSKFGLSPSDRSKLQILPENPDDDSYLNRSVNGDPWGKDKSN